MKRTVLTNVHVSYPFISALCFELTSTVVHISGITVATTHVDSVTDLDIKGMQGDIPWLTAGITKTTVTAFAKKLTIGVSHQIFLPCCLQSSV